MKKEKSNEKKHFFKSLVMTAILFLAFFGATWVGFVDMSSKLSAGKWIMLFVWYFAFIYGGDFLLRKVFSLK